MEKDFRPNVEGKQVSCSICKEGTLQFLDPGNEAVLMVACPTCGIVGHSCRQAYGLVMEDKLPVLPITPLLGVSKEAFLKRAI